MCRTSCAARTPRCHPVGTVDPAHLEYALGRYGGDFLDAVCIDEVDSDNWILVERERLRMQMMDASGMVIRHYLDTGHYRQGIQLASCVLQMDDLRKHTHCLMVRQAAVE